MSERRIAKSNGARSGSVMQLSLAVVLSLLSIGGCSASTRTREPVAGECTRTEECRRHGSCSRTPAGACEPRADVDCWRSEGCIIDGLCSLRDNMCVAASDDDCRKAGICRADGKCAEQDGTCRVGSTSDCRASTGCDTFGSCTMMVAGESGFECSAQSDADCRASLMCRGEGWCFALNGECVAERVLRK